MCSSFKMICQNISSQTAWYLLYMLCLLHFNCRSALNLVSAWSLHFCLPVHACKRPSCTHAAASVFIICACVFWQSGESTEGFPQRPRCRSVCSVKGKDHLPGLGEISATCRCWGIYPSTRGKKTKQGVGWVTIHRERGVWPRKSRPHGQVQHIHNLIVCHF